MYEEQAKQTASPLEVGMSYGKLPAGRGSVALAGQAGAMMGQGAMGAMGFQTPAEKKQAALAQVQAKFPDPKTVADFMSLGNALRPIDPGRAEKAFDQAKELRPTVSTKDPLLHDNRVREMKAVDFIRAYGNTNSIADKNALKQQMVDKGLAATKVYTGLVSEINTLTAAGINEGKDTQNRQQKLAKQLVDANIPSLNVAVDKMESMIAKHEGGLPGINYLEKFDPRSGAKETYSAFSQLRNIVLKARSGAAVTNPEFTRLQEEIRGATFVTDDDVIRWTSRLREVLETDKGAIFSGYGTKVKEAYWSTDNPVRMYKAPGKNESKVIKKGDIRNGYVYKGGDVKDPQNWSKQ